MITEQMRIDTLHARMNEERAEGNHIFLRQFIDREFPEYGDSPEYRLERYYHDMGMDYHNITVSQLVDAAQRDPLYGFLYTETILPPLFEALYSDADYRLLLAYSKPDNNPVVTQPYVTAEMKNTRKKEKALADGETPDTHKLNISAKFTSSDTYGDILEIPYNTIADVRLPVLSYFLSLYVLNTNYSKLARVVYIIINGDDATDVKTKQTVVNSANVIGINDTNTGITFRDIKTPCLRMSRLRFPANVLVGQETIIDDVSELEEFKKPYDGKPIHSFKISGNSIIPSQGIICDEVGDNNLLLLSTKGGIAEYIRQGLMLEREKMISKRTVVLAFSERLHFQNLMRQAKVMIDKTKAFSSNGFADYMTPTTPG